MRGGALDPRDAGDELTSDLQLPRARQLRLGEDHEIGGRPRAALQPTEALAQQALRPVAFDRATEAAADGEAEPVLVPPVRRCQEHEEPAVETDPAAEDTVELRTLAQALARSKTRHGPRRGRPVQAARRLRPF